MGIICYICGEEQEELYLHARKEHPNHILCFQHLLSGKGSATIETWGHPPQERLTFKDAPMDEVIYNKLFQLGYKMGQTEIVKHLAPLSKVKEIDSEILPTDYFGEYPESLITIRKIDPNDLPFTLSARFMCQHCNVWGKKRTCPPIIKTVKYYRNMVKRYKHCYLLILQSDGRAGWHTRPDGMKRKWGRTLIGVDTALTAFAYNIIQDIVWRCRDSKIPVFVCLTGSCKRCKRPGCVLPPEPCRHPLPGGISPESMGVDVMKLLHSLEIPVQNPVFDFITRLGIVFTKKEIR